MHNVLTYDGGTVAILEDSQIKAIKDEDREMRGGADSVVVGGISIRFDDDNAMSGSDLTGQWFGRDTYFGPSKGGNVDVYFHHAHAIRSDDIALNVSRAMADHTFGVAKATEEEMGIWVETVLNMRDEYEKEVAELVKANKIGWSSGSAGHLVRIEHVRDMEDMPESRRDELMSKFWYPGKITRWPVVEHSLTPTPAEPRNMVRMEDDKEIPMRCIKTLDSKLFVPDNKDVLKVFTFGGFKEQAKKADLKHEEKDVVVKGKLELDTSEAEAKVDALKEKATSLNDELNGKSESGSPFTDEQVQDLHKRLRALDEKSHEKTTEPDPEEEAKSVENDAAAELLLNNLKSDLNDLFQTA